MLMPEEPLTGAHYFQSRLNHPNIIVLLICAPHHTQSSTPPGPSTSSITHLAQLGLSHMNTLSPAEQIVQYIWVTMETHRRVTMETCRFMSTDRHMFASQDKQEVISFVAVVALRKAFN